MRWLSVVIGLIMAKPAAAVIIKIGLTISSSADEALQLAAGIIGLLVAGMMPLFAATFVSFVNNNAHGSMDSGAVGGGQQAGRRVSNVFRSGGRGISSAGRNLTRVIRRR